MKASVYIILVLFFYSCNRNTEYVKDIVAKPKINKAITVLYPTSGNSVSGTVEFVSSENGIRVNVMVTGLTPGRHGFHIHQFGDCSSPDAESAGGHFNPHNVDHGARTDSIRHIGDFGNLEADSTGRAAISFLDTLISFEGINSIIGRAVIIHENEDDLRSQPTGNAGARLACGVIGISPD
jgi:superoxide dismutase, Cu-Zn family